jgi:hypothetical protein
MAAHRTLGILRTLGGVKAMTDEIAKWRDLDQCP